MFVCSCWKILLCFDYKKQNFVFICDLSMVELEAEIIVIVVVLVVVVIVRAMVVVEVEGS